MNGITIHNNKTRKKAKNKPLTAQCSSMSMSCVHCRRRGYTALMTHQRQAVCRADIVGALLRSLSYQSRKLF